MIIRRYLVWASTATASQRAKAADALVRAYAQSPLSPSDRDDVLKALDDLARDESPEVRRALAEALSRSPEVPQAILAKLAEDGEAALPLLATSPALTTEQLVDCAAVGDVTAQMAIAGRQALPVPAAAALAEIAPADVLVKLAANEGAKLSPGVLERMLSRVGDDPEFQAALGTRRDLPAFTRQAIAARMSERLAQFAVQQGWLSPAEGERLHRQARDAATVAMAAEADASELARLVTHLIESDQLTIGLLLRALLSGETALVEIALADLAGISRDVAHAALYERKGAGFARLYRRAGLAEGLLPVFTAALDAFHDVAIKRPADGRLSPGLVAGALQGCRAMPEEAAAPVLALLEGFAAEAAEHAVTGESEISVTAVDERAGSELPRALAA
ncbi:DUF2336 domain-containing protein [Chelatococcus sp. GCM10030263]|uniref:DUF2336 domain-containing protein n=1 Tax=Chelatococcus sp. GCM10030263 TaxID=3273387 RepID=UPI003608BA16